MKIQQSALTLAALALVTVSASIDLGRPALAKGGVKVKSAAGHPGGRSSNPLNFKRFQDEKDAWKLLNDVQVQQRMRVVAGNDIEHFMDWAYSSDKLEKTGTDLFTPFSMIGGAGYTAFLNFNYATGNACLGYADDDSWHVYANGAKLPAPVENFLKSDSRELAYEKPNHKPLVTFKATVPKKNLNLSSVTGTYEREPSRFTTALLKVQSLSNGKIKFSVFANLGGRTGGTSDEVPLIDNRAICKGPGSEPGNLQFIKIDFLGRDAVISGHDEVFCGSGVTLAGIYHKIDDRTPDSFDSE